MASFLLMGWINGVVLKSHNYPLINYYVDVGNRTATIESAQILNLNSFNPAVRFSGGSQRISLGYSGTGVLGNS